MNNNTEEKIDELCVSSRQNFITHCEDTKNKIQCIHRSSAIHIQATQQLPQEERRRSPMGICKSWDLPVKQEPVDSPRHASSSLTMTQTMTPALDWTPMSGGTPTVSGAEGDDARQEDAHYHDGDSFSLWCYLFWVYSLLICPPIDAGSAYLTKVVIEISPQVISIRFRLGIEIESNSSKIHH